MSNQSEKGRRTNDDGKSEGCIVPTKPGNSGGAKAAKRWWSFREALPGRTIHRLYFDSGADRVVVGECLREPDREWLSSELTPWMMS